MPLITWQLKSRPLAATEPQPPLAEADPGRARRARLPDDDVVKDLDVKQRTRLDHLSRQRYVLRRGSWVPARMVVREHQGGSLLAYRLPEHLGRANDRAIQASSRQLAPVLYSVLGVQQDNPHLLPLQAAHVELEQLVDALGARDLGLFLRRPHHEPLAQLKGGFEVDGLHPADAGRPLELELTGPADAVEISVPGQQLAGDVEDVMRLRARTQDDGDELFVRQRLGTEGLQTLPRADARREITNRQVVGNGAVANDRSPPGASRLRRR